MAKRVAWTTMNIPRETVVEMVHDHVKDMLNQPVEMGHVEVKRNGSIEVTFRPQEAEPALPLGEAGTVKTGDTE